MTIDVKELANQLRREIEDRQKLLGALCQTFPEAQWPDSLVPGEEKTEPWREIDRFCVRCHIGIVKGENPAQFLCPLCNGRMRDSRGALVPESEA